MELRLNLSRFAYIVLRWSWLIVLSGVLGGAIAFLASQALPKEYESEAKVLIGSLSEANYDQQLGYQQLAATYAGMATITPVLDRVIAQLGLADDPAELASRTDVRAPLNQSMVMVVAKASSAVGSSQLANALAAEVVKLGESPDKANLASLIQRAVPPVGPSAPNVFVNTLIGAVLGLSLGTCLALLLVSWRGTPSERGSDFASGDRNRPET